MSQYRNFPFFENEFTKSMSQFKVPGIDVEAVLSAQRRNIEAFTAANRLAIEGVQAVMRRQLEIFRQTVEETSQNLRELNAASAPEEKVTKHIDALRASYEHALANMHELTEMLSKSNSEAGDLIQSRVSESLSEMKQAIKKTHK